MGLGNLETAKKNSACSQKAGMTSSRCTEVLKYDFDNDESEDSSSSGNRV